MEGAKTKTTGIVHTVLCFSLGRFGSHSCCRVCRDVQVVFVSARLPFADVLCALRTSVCRAYLVGVAMCAFTASWWSDCAQVRCQTHAIISSNPQFHHSYPCFMNLSSCVVVTCVFPKPTHATRHDTPLRLPTFDCFGCASRTSDSDGSAALASAAAASATSGGRSGCRRIVPRDHHVSLWGGNNTGDGGDGGGGGGGGGGGDPLQLPGGRRAAAERVRTFSVRADDYSMHELEAEDVGKSPAQTAMPQGAESMYDALSGYGGGGGGSGGSGSGGSGSGSDHGSDRYVRLAGAHVTAFLRTSLLMVHVCMETSSPLNQETPTPAGAQATPPPPPRAGAGSERIAQGSGARPSAGPAWAEDGMAACLPGADDKFLPLCEYFGFPSSAETLLAEPGLMSAARRCVSARAPTAWVCFGA